MSMHVPQGTRAASISAVVRRADGTLVDYGVVSAYHRLRLRRWLFALGLRLRRHKEG